MVSIGVCVCVSSSAGECDEELALVLIAAKVHARELLHAQIYLVLMNRRGITEEKPHMFAPQKR